MIDNLRLFEMVRRCLARQVALSEIITYLGDNITEDNRDRACELIRVLYNYIGKPYVPVSFCIPLAN